MRFFFALAVATMAVIHGIPAAAGEIADSVYAEVMDWVGNYGQLNEPKVMAICVDWGAPTGSGIRVHNVFIHYTGISSDGPIFVTELGRHAIHRCETWADSEKIECTCQMMDKNGKNVLEVPARD